MKYIGKLFNKYKVNFPIEEDIVIIIGMNGTGKTKTLELLRNYYLNNKDNVLYFPSDRILTITKDDAESVETSIETMLKLMGSQYPIYFKDYRNFKYTKKGEYINNGILQFQNFVTNIALGGKNLKVLIDMPEINLDLNKENLFIKTLTLFSNIKQLVIVTHSPSIMSTYSDKAYDIEKIVNIFE
ncbi:MAG: hypothetical protein ACOCP8_00370 [archaeon]